MGHPDQTRKNQTSERPTQPTKDASKDKECESIILKPPRNPNTEAVHLIFSYTAKQNSSTLTKKLVLQITPSKGNKHV